MAIHLLTTIRKEIARLQRMIYCMLASRNYEYNAYWTRNNLQLLDIFIKNCSCEFRKSRRNRWLCAYHQSRVARPLTRNTRRLLTNLRSVKVTLIWVFKKNKNSWRRDDRVDELASAGKSRSTEMSIERYLAIVRA